MQHITILNFFELSYYTLAFPKLLMYVCHSFRGGMSVSLPSFCFVRGELPFLHALGPFKNANSRLATFSNSHIYPGFLFFFLQFLSLKNWTLQLVCLSQLFTFHQIKFLHFQYSACLITPAFNIQQILEQKYGR